jgi:FHA domain-containing protein
MPTPLTLEVYRGDELVRTERFTREIIKIGRLSSAHLCLEDERISRIHSVIEVGQEGVSIIDMGSAEGTFVNGKRVSKGPLKRGDEIKLGGLRIVVGGEGIAAGVNRALGVPAAAAKPPHANGHASGPVNGHARNGHAGSPLPLPQPGAAAVALRAEPVAAPEATAARPPRPALALVRPIDEEPVEEGAPDLGVELRVLWGDALLDAGTFVAPKQPIVIGEGPRCHFRLTAPNLPSATFPVLRHDAGEYRFLFARGMRGGVDEGGKVRTFGELVKARTASQDDAVEGAWSVPVPRAGIVRAELGSGLCVEARFRRPPKPAVVPWWERLDYRYLNLLLVLLFLQGGFIVAAKTTTRDIDLVQDDLAKGQQRMAKFVMKAPEQQKVNPYLEKLKSDLKKEQPGEMAERHKGDEGQMGKKDAPKTNGRSAPKAIDPNAKELVKNSGLLAALGKGRGTGGLSTVFGQGGLGGDLKGAIGNMYGPVVGDSRGVGGLGLKGTGTGGGGAGETIGIGAVGTKGRGGGLGGYGSGVGGLGAKRDRDVAIATGETKVLGAIDPELIRKVIRDHADQVRYCYEQQLTLNPKLGGKVAIKWQINADGRASATILDPSVPIDSDGLRTVGECIMSRIRTWEFPKPKGGGMAIVTYPWILRSSGSGTAG